MEPEILKTARALQLQSPRSTLTANDFQDRFRQIEKAIYSTNPEIAKARDLRGAAFYPDGGGRILRPQAYFGNGLDKGITRPHSMCQTLGIANTSASAAGAT